MSATSEASVLPSKEVLRLVDVKLQLIDFGDVVEGLCQDHFRPLVVRLRRNRFDAAHPLSAGKGIEDEQQGVAGLQIGRDPVEVDRVDHVDVGDRQAGRPGRPARG